MFRTTYVDTYSGIEQFDTKVIAKNYLKGRFWIDLLATIPFDTISLIAGGSSSALQLFGILKLVRIARLSKIISYMNVKEDLKQALKLTKLIFFLIMYLHILGCTWHWIVREDQEWIPPLDYVFVTSTFFEQSVSYKYWMSLYHAVLMLTGNDIGPRNDTFQTIFVTVFVTFGAILNAYIFGELVVLVSVMNEKNSQFVKKLDICNTAMKNQSLPKQIQTEVIGYLTYTKTLLDSQQELETFLDLISPSLKEKVIRHIFTEALKDNEIFNSRPSLMESLTRRLSTKIYQPEEEVVRQGEDTKEVYFIAKGGCGVFILDANNQTEQVNHLEPGNLFGEVAVLNDCCRTATVKTSNYSTISSISKEAFEMVFNRNQDALKILKDGRKKYQDNWKLFMKDMLRYIDYIKNCAEETVEELTYFLKQQTYNTGDVIFKSGDPVNKIHFVAIGEVDIVVQVGKKEVVLDTLFQACNIGEYGVLGDHLQTFAAVAKTNNTQIVTLAKESLK